MLVLSRKLGEQVVIPKCDMTVTVVAIEGNNVRLGFTAPRSVDVFRQELLDSMQSGEAVGTATSVKRRNHS